MLEGERKGEVERRSAYEGSSLERPGDGGTDRPGEGGIEWEEGDEAENVGREGGGVDGRDIRRDDIYCDSRADSIIRL